MRTLQKLLLLGVVLANHSANAATQQYAAHEESIYTGAQIASDSGSPDAPGNEGDFFLQFLSFTPLLDTLVVDATVSWDETVEQLIGFTQVSTLKELQVKDTETVTWRFGAGNWSAMSNEVVWGTLVTTIFDRSPLLAPLAPADGGGSGNTDPYPTPEQLQEMELAGVPDAACTYLGKCDGYLDGLTREQYLRDMKAIETILAGSYNPVPVPAPLVLLGSSLSVLFWRACRARHAGETRVR